MNTQSLENLNSPALGSVRTVHILSTGQLIFSLEEYKKVQDRFSWVDRTFILSEIFRLRPLTDSNRFSFVAIYEEGREIKPILNLEPEFYLSQLQHNGQK